MKKKLFLAAVLLAALATGYTAWAYFSTRGVAVYLLGIFVPGLIIGMRCHDDVGRLLCVGVDSGVICREGSGLAQACS